MNDDLEDVYSDDSVVRFSAKLQYYKDEINELFNHCDDEHIDYMFDLLELEEKSIYVENKRDKLRNVWIYVLKNFDGIKINFFYLYFYEKLNQKEIADVMCCSQVYISLILSRMIKKINYNLNYMYEYSYYSFKDFYKDFKYCPVEEEFDELY